MENGSKAAKFQSFDFNEFELIDNRNLVRKYQKNEKAGNFSKGIMEKGSSSGSSRPLRNQPNSKYNPSASDQNNELLESPSENKGRKLAPSGTSPGDPTLKEASQMQKTAEQVELVSSSPGNTDESFPHHANSNQNLMQPTYPGLEGSDSSLGAATDAQQTTSPLFSPLIMETAQSFPLALAEKIPLNGSNRAHSFHPEHEVNSVQANHLNGQIGSSFQAEPRRVEPVNKGKAIMFGDQSEQNNGNNNFSDNQQALNYPNLFPQSASGIGFLNGGSTQISHQTPTWISNKENDFYRHLAPLGSQVNQIKATNNSDPQCYNFMLPGSSAPLRPQHFSYQPNQVPTVPAAYNSQSCSTILPESSMSLRTQIMPPHHQISPLDVSDLQYPNSVQPKASMLSSGGFIFQDLSDPGHHQFNQAKLITNQIGSQYSNSMLQESLMRSGSHQLPPHQQASNQFPMMPSLLNSENHNFELPESSLLPRLQTVQQGLQNQTARPIATYPSSGTFLSSLLSNSLLQQETGGTSAPLQMETSLSSQNEQGISGRRGHARNRFELGESSSFKRFRRESIMPQASSAEQVNRTSLSLQNEVTGSNIGSLSYPRPIRNSVYDPIFEWIGLPIDPHLRMFPHN